MTKKSPKKKKKDNVIIVKEFVNTPFTEVKDSKSVSIKGGAVSDTDWVQPSSHKDQLRHENVSVPSSPSRRLPTPTPREAGRPLEEVTSGAPRNVPATTTNNENYVRPTERSRERIRDSEVVRLEQLRRNEVRSRDPLQAVDLNAMRARTEMSASQEARENYQYNPQYSSKSSTDSNDVFRSDFALRKPKKRF